MTVKGVPSESGPNAILLSDVMIQGGDFSNLAEFPVLQMLYRQGMLLPGHPGNTGAHPLLIGTREQVDAQIQYIFRGNYGLISEAELMAAGVPEEQAREMMRLKLRFAFGRIQNPRDLLDSIVLENAPVEIRPGLTLRRIALNTFEFTYGDESLFVDLNLPEFQTYECPYPLGATQFRREYFAVINSGDGDGWDIRRPTTGSVVVFQGRIYMVDAGPNLSHSLRALGIGINEVEGIFQTHSHDDHFAGLTTLMRADRRIKYFAVGMVRSAVAKKICALLSIEEKDFDNYFDVHDLVMDAWNDVDGLDVKPVFSPHPVENTIFHFRAMAEGGYRSYAHFADLVGLKALKNMVTDDPAKPGLTADLYERVVRSYAEPADIKKVDIGGGMIHGEASDFISDTSGKVMLAHTAQPLNAEQRRIGSGASFGAVDVLIASHRDFLGRAAYNFLHEYFPSVSGEHIGAILNGPILTFNPETILLKGGQTHRSIYLLLTGLVEMFDDHADFHTELSAGALLGEMTGLHGLPAAETFRAMSFVQVLAIPCDLYVAFVQRHRLFADICRLMEQREFLSRTWLLGGVVATETLNAIAKDMRLQQFAAGEVLNRWERSVGLIQEGRIERTLGDDVLETLGPGDFFGEEGSVFDAPPIASLRAKMETQVYMISPRLLAEIPNVRWKLFETFERRTHMEMSAPTEGRSLMVWHEEYSVGIHRIDIQHRRLFVAANTLLDVVESNRGYGEVGPALDFMVDYAKHHFAEEEELMVGHGYPGHMEHKRSHGILMTQVRELEAAFKQGSPPTPPEMLNFLHGWIVSHILIEDRKYAAFLNEKGISW